MRRQWAWAALVVSLCLATGAAPAAEGEDTSTPQNTPLSTRERLGACLYVQTSAEYRACCLQVFHMAADRLGAILKYLEEKEKPAPRPLAVMMDLDETVLDNSAFESFLFEQDKHYTPELWARYERDYPQAVRLVPGAKAFIEKVEALGVTVVYVSNRQEKFQASTVAALKRLEINTKGIERRLFLKDDTSDKSARRQAVAKRYWVVLRLGDNLRDFSEVFAAPELDASAGEEAFDEAVRVRLNQVDTASEHWGRDWFVLPNPCYGEWEKLLGPDPVRRLYPSGIPAVDGEDR